eukprot:CAMPEP_0170581256 /NCGR_PEP_ID=MMETSP0224-20130122/6941_1 /TAXON_ID=285029 /ORGANISM="Togula jolla, Strain CCCM 725" /LENGTH=499 /DNA_ID=CAMNT_0010904377 /DNA_START=112 /DNA_END=1611 /DNA_ORIENTATION=-
MARLQAFLTNRTQVLNNARMVEDLVDSGALQTERCISAFMAIDRHHFFWAGHAASQTDGFGDHVYHDTPLRNGRLHQSAPHIYARALEALLPLDSGMSFLNIGSGTGYFSSIVSELIGNDAVNDGLDIWQECIDHAKDRCRAAGKTGIEFTTGNVYHLDVDSGTRYDRIYVGACANSRSKYLYNLLEVGGILVGPFQAGPVQQLRRVVRQSETYFAVEVLNAVQFASLVEPPRPFPAAQALGNGSPRGHVPGAGLPGVPFSFTLRERPWSLERHAVSPASFRSVTSAVLLGRPCDPTKICLPPEIWAKHVLPWCSRRWFEAPVETRRTTSTKALAALAVASVAAKRALLGVASWGDLSDGGLHRASSDGGSTRATSANGSLGPSRSNSHEDPGLDGPWEGEHTVFFEAFGDGPHHIIGSDSDPDDMTQQDRSALLANLLDGAPRTRREAPRPAEPRGQQNQRAAETPARRILRCIERCFLTVASSPFCAQFMTSGSRRV